MLHISIHALREEGDAEEAVHGRGCKEFLSTPSARRATGYQEAWADYRYISIHALREEGDDVYMQAAGWDDISIHALREEGDIPNRKKDERQNPISIHALREEGDHAATLTLRAQIEISIHALREEGDFMPLITSPICLIFLSTPSARRATICLRQTRNLLVISIHALREEGDSARKCSYHRGNDFYPRPPRGGRHSVNRHPVQSY